MRKACVAESGVDEKHIIASVNGHLPDDPQLACYILCLLEHSGMIEDDGTIHFNDVYHLLTPAMQASADKVVKECETKRKWLPVIATLFFGLKNKRVDFPNLDGSTRCETAYQTVKCYFEVEPEVEIFSLIFIFKFQMSNQMLIQSNFHFRVPNYHSTTQTISFIQCPNTNCSNVIYAL